MKVFIAGPRAISVLDKPVEERLNNILANSYTVLVGDANGVDRAVQKHFSSLDYGNVIVFASEGKARNNVGNWEIRSINVPEQSKGFNYYAAKDIAMSDDADYGFMIWNGESKGTLNNIINLLNLGKNSIVYLTKTNSFYTIDSISKLLSLVTMCGNSTQTLFEKLRKASASGAFQQTSLF